MTKAMWVITFHMMSSLAIWPMFMKLLSRSIPEIATIDEISFSLRPPKSRLPIQDGRSSSPVSIRDTKFS
jgi:hypothetical protein